MRRGATAKIPERNSKKSLCARLAGLLETNWRRHPCAGWRGREKNCPAQPSPVTGEPPTTSGRQQPVAVGRLSVTQISPCQRPSPGGPGALQTAYKDLSQTHGQNRLVCAGVAAQLASPRRLEQHKLTSVNSGVAARSRNFPLQHDRTARPQPKLTDQWELVLRCRSLRTTLIDEAPQTHIHRQSQPEKRRQDGRSAETHEGQRNTHNRQKPNDHSDADGDVIEQQRCVTRDEQ